MLLTLEQRVTVMNSRPAENASDSEAQDQLTGSDELTLTALAQAALDGLADIAEGRLIEDIELDQALAVVLPQPGLKD